MTARKINKPFIHHHHKNQTSRHMVDRKKHMSHQMLSREQKLSKEELKKKSYHGLGWQRDGLGKEGFSLTWNMVSIGTLGKGKEEAEEEASRAYRVLYANIDTVNFHPNGPRAALTFGL